MGSSLDLRRVMGACPSAAQREEQHLKSDFEDNSARTFPRACPHGVSSNQRPSRQPGLGSVAQLFLRLADQLAHRLSLLHNGSSRLGGAVP